MKNIVIIGSGPAGLTAAIYAARANLAPLLIEGMEPGGQLSQTTDVENFPGFANPIAGPDLMQAMRSQAERLGVRLVMDEVTSVRFAPGDKATEGHTLELSLGDAIKTKSVIVATGASARYLGLPSEQKLIGHGVSGCATCDGAFFRDQPVAVVGGGDTALEEALYLARIASKVTVIHRRDAFRASRIMGDRVLANDKIDVCWDHVVDEVLDVDKGSVTGVRLKNVKTGQIAELSVNGLFVAIGHTPNTGAFKDQLEMDTEGYITTHNTRTNIPGVFAAGDVQDRQYRQAVTAAGSGCMAALEAERYLGAMA